MTRTEGQRANTHKPRKRFGTDCTEFTSIRHRLSEAQENLIWVGVNTQINSAFVIGRNCRVDVEQVGHWAQRLLNFVDEFIASAHGRLHRKLRRAMRPAVNRILDADWLVDLEISRSLGRENFSLPLPACFGDRARSHQPSICGASLTVDFCPISGRLSAASFSQIFDSTFICLKGVDDFVAAKAHDFNRI